MHSVGSGRRVSRRAPRPTRDFDSSAHARGQVRELGRRLLAGGSGRRIGFRERRRLRRHLVSCARTRAAHGAGCSGPTGVTEHPAGGGLGPRLRGQDSGPVHRRGQGREASTRQAGDRRGGPTLADGAARASLTDCSRRAHDHRAGHDVVDPVESASPNERELRGQELSASCPLVSPPARTVGHRVRPHGAGPLSSGFG